MTDVVALLGRGVLREAPLRIRSQALAAPPSVPERRSLFRIPARDRLRGRRPRRRHVRTSHPDADKITGRGASPAHAGSRPHIPSVSALNSASSWFSTLGGQILQPIRRCAIGHPSSPPDLLL